MRISPEQIFDKMAELADDYERLRAILDEKEPLYDIAKDEVLNNIQARRFDEFNADNKEVLELAMISKLTIEEKNAIFRGEYPVLVDQVQRAQKTMKRIEQSFAHYSSMNISNMSSRKHEIAVNGGRA